VFGAMSSPLQSIVEVLSSWASKQPAKIAWTFIDDKGVEVETYTYSELDMVTSDLAVYLLEELGLKEGDRAMLVFIPGLDFMVALLACFKARVVAVPVFPPDPFKLKKDMHHFVSIQESSGSAVALTHGIYNSAKKAAKLSSFFSLSSSGGAKWPDHLQWQAVDAVIKKAKAAAKKGSVGATSSSTTASQSKMAMSPAADEHIAFLQYTSGSTSEPKGVVISHANLAHNQMLIAAELKTSPETVCVSWLPQYHDMGLIGSYLGTIQCGGRGVYMSSISFLKDPLLWVRTLSKYRGTHTQAPSFAYALSVRKLAELKRRGGTGTLELDLSATQHMINAAEPVDPGAMQAFYEAFSAYQLPQGVVVPTYGLAEHTVFVCSGGTQVERFSKAALEQHRAVVVPAADESEGGSGKTKTDAADEGRLLVGCGYPKNAKGVDLRIVDAETRAERAEGEVGEVWVRSPSKAGGYWDRHDLSLETFRANLAGAPASTDVAADGYLRTGDLGFLHKDELFICGRIKDLLIVRGSNHYPQDIERTAESCEAMKGIMRQGRSAVFAVPIAGSSASHDDEGVVLLAELQAGASTSVLEAAMTQCRDAISTDHGIALSHICLVQTRTIPKTTSGKIARAWCRKEFLAKKLSVVKEMAFTGNGETGSGSGLGDGTVAPLSVSGGDGGAVVGVDTDGEAAAAAEAAMANLRHFEGPADVRAASEDELAHWLETHLVMLSLDGPVPLSAPVDMFTPVSALGLDSMCLVQLSGVVQNQLHCSLPDEFLFTTMATLAGIAQAARLGKLTEQQQAAMEGVESVEVVQTKQPLCPWFVCCY